jgi:type 1 glutamine amidotransferase
VAFLAKYGAVDALAQLPGEGVDKMISEVVQKPGMTTTEARVALINAAVLRRSGFESWLGRMAHDKDDKVRVAYVKAVGRSGDDAMYEGMVAVLCNFTDLDDAFEDAIRQMGRRIADRQRRMKPLLEWLDRLPIADKANTSLVVALLRLLVPLGGDDGALAAVRARLDSPVEKVRDAAVRALCEWPDAAAFPDLQRVAADEGASRTHRALAERAVERMRGAWSRYAALVYMNCGTDKEAAGKQGVRLRVEGVEAWTFQEGAEGTVFFAGNEVRAEVSGLKDGRNHLLGFTWWDYDGNGRVQSVWVNGRMVLGPTALPDFKGKREGAASVTVVVPGDLIKGGKADVRFKREGASNALVSEVWVGEAPEGAEAKLPEPPPPAEVRANPGAPKKILILTGLEHHNNWRQNTPLLTAAFAEDKRLEVSVSEDPSVMARSEVLSKYDGFVLYYNNSDKRPSPEGALGALSRAVEEGRGLVLVHFASGAFYDWGTKKVSPGFAKIAGRVWNPKLRGHDPHGAFTVNIADKGHPVTKGLADFETVDELYTCLEGEAPIHVLATAVSKVDEKVYPIAFVLNPGKGRTFHCALGHDAQAFNAKALELFRRGTQWSVGLE